ncbi:MAG: type IV-A pilus assembly ATPase PilB [Nitrospinae bacterium]|nr:type IV-A pilus assembly ATPase PilB [Nitrospinota bacterium]
MATEQVVKKSSFKKTIKDDVQSDKLATILKKEGQITNAQLADAKELQKKNGGVLTTYLIQLEAIEEDDLLNFVSRYFSVPVVKPTELPINPQTLKVLPVEHATEHMVFPLKLTNDVLTIAMVDPTDNKAVDTIQQFTALSIKTALCSEKELLESYKKYYKIDDELYEKLKTKSIKGEDEGPVELETAEDLGSLLGQVEDELQSAGDEEELSEQDEAFSPDAAPIIKLVNNILVKAIKAGVSDIHIEPFEKSFQVRYRMDGTLFKSMSLPTSIKNALVSRIKILAELNIAERRIPQDGRIKLKLGKNRAIDFRVSCLPTLFGESIVLRLLDKGNLMIDFNRLGFTKEGVAKFMKAIKNPFGLVLVTGPTGSGKTNTLYSAVNYLNDPTVKILTAEDPVEFNFAGINQVLVRNEVGMTFAAALKAFLRQDPEIILVGEIRDMETAEIAIKAAMTGHLVFSTLHTNDCPSTIGRLIDIGIPGYMVASAVTCVVAQRLLKTICPDCKAETNEYSDEDLIRLGFAETELSDLKIYKGKGCPTCNGTGYKGRAGLFEIMEITEAVKQAITAQLPEDQLRKISVKEGMNTLRMEGLIKIREGRTTVEEVVAKTVLQKEALPSYLLNPDELVFEDGDIIIAEGNTDNNFYRLEQGSLAIYKDEVELAVISQPGEYFGEVAALMNQPRNATVKAKGKAIIKVFPGDKLFETVENYPEISHKLLTSLIRRLQDSDKKIVSDQKGNIY